MNHRYTQNQLSAYLDGELSLDARAAIGRHLRTCDSCVGMLADFRRNRQRISALAHQAPPIVHPVLAERPERRPGPRKFRFSFDSLRRPAAGVVTALAAACFILAVINLSPIQPEEDSLDLYFTVHAEHSTYNPLQSQAAGGLSLSNAKTAAATVADETDFLLEVYLGD